jgi:hypothetical protein
MLAERGSALDVPPSLLLSASPPWRAGFESLSCSDVAGRAAEKRTLRVRGANIRSR